MNSYNSNKLIANGKVIYDSKFRRIAYQLIDILNNQSPKIVKKFYLEDLGHYTGDDHVIDNGTFEFHYNFDDLEVDEIYVNVNLAPFVDSGGYIIDSDENILTHFLITPLFCWDDHPYYHSPDPLIPVTVV